MLSTYTSEEGIPSNCRREALPTFPELSRAYHVLEYKSTPKCFRLVLCVAEKGKR
jgi:hypothetical protein